MKIAGLKYKVSLKPIAESIFNAYAEVFFSESKIFGAILLLITFLDWPLGLAGLFSIIIANVTAYFLGFSKQSITKGYFAFNALLSGLGLAMIYEPGQVFFLILFVSAIFSFFITVSLKGFFGNYGLPYLSLPFILTLWIVTLAGREFINLGLNERAVYTLNTVYSRGGVQLMNFYQSIEELPVWSSLVTYFKSLAAIFFQQSLFAGFLISIGLLWFSRIAFSLSIIGFYAAYLFYTIIGADFESLNYTYIGFNYILASIAIGGYFLIPSKTTYVWVVIIIPLLATLTISLSKIFEIWHLPTYALSFNIMVLMFLYVLKLREKPGVKPAETIIQNNSPEKNFYAWQNDKVRFGNRTFTPIWLPFFGYWTVSQGYSGSYTHKGEWRHAWDFIINNNKGVQYKNEGLVAEDYYCYEKSVIAPADGVVVLTINNVIDNPVGDVNNIDNWGNTVIIKHNDYLYSKLSHLKKDSVKVKEGDRVKFGTVVGLCGNSGRSPYPHLHFQLQSTPYIGSPTLYHTIASYIKEENNSKTLKLYTIPQESDTIGNIQPDELLSNAFHFIPGEMLIWKDDKENVAEEWEVITSVYNKSYFYCKKTKSIAWFENDGALFYFTHFNGNRKSLLYHFYKSSFMVQLSFSSQMEINDSFPVNKIFKPHELILQDFIAPFYLFKKSAFKLRYKDVDNDSFPSEMTLSSRVYKTNWFEQKKVSAYDLVIGKNGLEKLIIKSKTGKISVSCTKS